MSNQHVSKHKNGGWQVKGEGNEKASSIHDTQNDAITAAKTIAKNQGTGVVIHGADGKIRQKESYGNGSIST
ncbi:DUF2188 domain-containing protein [Metabacillus sp. RGM 3146]|uniref:DUF2188 domain-containing protein n=1 Tax=Metabacillus sp. RGM 3146 TaxID=3401092 RepID=UPI003B9CF290